MGRGAARSSSGLLGAATAARALVRLSIAWLLVASCGARHAERPAVAPPGEASGGGSTDGRQGAAIAGVAECPKPRQAPSTFVGFSERMSLRDFDLAAFEAGRIVRLLKAQLCALSQAQDTEGSLRRALTVGTQIEIAAVRFTSDDAGTADVHVRVAGATDVEVDPGAYWRLELVRDPTAWRIVSTSRP